MYGRFGFVLEYRLAGDFVASKFYLAVVICGGTEGMMYQNRPVKICIYPVWNFMLARI